MAKKLKAATIAEVVIALTIIAVCFAIAARVFMQSSRSATEFSLLVDETHFQGQLFKSFLNDSMTLNENELELGEIEAIPQTDQKLPLNTFTLQTTDKVLWQQEIYVEKN